MAYKDKERTNEWRRRKTERNNRAGLNYHGEPKKRYTRAPREQVTDSELDEEALRWLEGRGHK